MKVEKFVLSLNEVSGEEIGIATWAALKASAWVLYSAQLMAMAASKEFDTTTLSDEKKIEIARRAFAYVADNLPPENPFRGELERFAAEALTIDDIPPMLLN